MSSGRAFPQSFSLISMDGSRRDHFADQKPEVGFQALVGDWLLSVDPHAVAPPTVGADGRIDIYVRSLPPSPPPLLSKAAGPLIVECKWHDSSSPQCWDNVKRGWANVASALTKAAEAGWRDRYEPWKTAKAYLYCLSVTCPDPQARLSLEAEIKTFFTSKPG